jgi:tetratricopeptide (TPR) repeat protein
MKKHFWIGVAWIAMLSGSPAFAQFGSIKGVCKDARGKPIAGAQVELHGVETTRSYKFKTDSKGEYSSIAVMPGRYNAVLLKDEHEIDSVNGVVVGISEMRLDFDLQHATSTAHQSTAEEQQLQAKQQYTAAVVKVLNEKLEAANQSIKSGDFDTAIATLTDATKVSPNVDLVWARLGGAYLASAPKQTDADEKAKRFGEAADSYQKAIDVRQKQTVPAKQTPEQATVQAEDLAGYYNNLAHAEAKSGKLDEAVKSYNQAAQINPSGAYLYYYNQGAILYNAGKPDEAIEAYDKSIAADPTKPDAYYQKGVVLISKAVNDKNGKVTPAPGTLEALNKYLEMAPNGQFVNEAKGLIQYIGGTATGRKK